MTKWNTPGDAGLDSEVAATLVGRDSELQLLSQAAGSDDATVILIEGSPGIGKSHLIRAFQRYCRQNFRTLWPTTPGQRCPMLFAQCQPQSDPFPFQSLVEGLGGIDPRHLADVQLSSTTGVLRSMVPQWADVLPHTSESLDDPDMRQQVLCQVLEELFDVMGTCLMVFEDAHWADSASLDFLAARCSEDSRQSTLVLTCRPDEVAASSPLRALAAGAGQQPFRQHRLQLWPLSPPQVRRMVSSLLNTPDISDEFVQLLYAQSRGVPLLVEETVTLLRARADLVQSGEHAWMRRDLGDLLIPATLHESVLERLQGLGAPARRLLEAAAVFRRPAPEALLQRLSGLDATQLAAGRQIALDALLLRRDRSGHCHVNHALQAAAIYHAMPLAQRQDLHQQSAEWLEATDPGCTSELTWHYRHAGNTVKWGVYAEKSAEHALLVGDVRSAGILLRRILTNVELPPDEGVRIGLKLARNTVYEFSNSGKIPADVVTVLRALLDRADLSPIQRGAVRCQLGLMLNLADSDEGREEIRQSARELEQDPALVVEAMVMLCRPWNSMRPVSDRRQWLARAMALLPRVRDPVVRTTLEIECAIPRLELGLEMTWDGVDAHVQTLERRVQIAIHTRKLASNYINLAILGILWGRPQRVDAWLDKVQQLTSQSELWIFQPSLQINRACLRYFTGRWVGLAELIAGQGDDGYDPGSRASAGLVQGLLALPQAAAPDELHAAEKVLEQALGACDFTIHHHLVIMLQAALGKLHLGNNQADKALQHTGECVRRIEQIGYWPWSAEILPVHIAALIQSGELDTAETLTGKFELGLQDYDAPAAQAAALLCRAHCCAARARHEAAAGRYARAAAEWAAMSRPYDRWLALEQQSTCLAALNQPQPARELLIAVEQGLADLGAWRDLRRVQARLAERPAEKAAPAAEDFHYGKAPGERLTYEAPGPAVLTAWEYSIARLAAENYSNEDIAARMEINLPTVVKQLHLIMDKLKVRNRQELTRRMLQSGLVDMDADTRKRDPEVRDAEAQNAEVQTAEAERAAAVPVRHPLPPLLENAVHGTI